VYAFWGHRQTDGRTNRWTGSTH